MAAGLAVCAVLLALPSAAADIEQASAGPEAHVPVLIVPGLLGSVLMETSGPIDRLLWPGTVLFGGDIRPLELSETGDDLSYRIEPQGLVGFAEPLLALESLEASSLARLAPAWIESWLPDTVRFLSYYGGVIAAFRSAGYHLDEDLFTFPYDWRRDLTETSRLLEARIDEIARRTGSEAIDVVAHSMGGLVVRSYVNRSDNPKIRKLVLMGTPSHGAPDAYVALHPNLGRGRLLLEDANAQELSANWPSVYQLLPTPRYFEIYGHIFDDRFGEAHEGPLTGPTGEAAWQRTFVENPDSSLAGVNEFLLTGSPSRSARAFQNLIGADLRFSGELVLIAGSGTETVGSLVKSDSPGEIWQSVPTNGDGTVPLWSATRLESLGPVSIYHTTAGHETMLGDAAVGQLLPVLLAGTEDDIVQILDESATLQREVSTIDGLEDESFDLETDVPHPKP